MITSWSNCSEIRVWCWLQLIVGCKEQHFPQHCRISAVTVFLPPNFYCVIYMPFYPLVNYRIKHSSDIQAGMHEIFEPRWMLGVTSCTGTPQNPSTVIITWALTAAWEFGIFSVNTHVFIFPCVLQTCMWKAFRTYSLQTFIECGSRVYKWPSFLFFF